MFCLILSAIEYNKKIAERVKRALTEQNKNNDENNLTSAGSNNVDCRNIQENQSPANERQINESNTQLKKHDVSDKTIVPQLDDTLGSNDDDLYTMETGSEERQPVNLQRTYAHNDEHFGSHKDETETGRKSVLEDPRLLNDLYMLESVANCKLSKNEYADCGIWDFAGQKEFYATHQAFITSNCIFLLVADISKDVNTGAGTSMSQRGFDSIGGILSMLLHCIFP